MSNFKRKKSKQSIRCDMCTDGRQGNSMKELTGRTSKIFKLKRAQIQEDEQDSSWLNDRLEQVEKEIRDSQVRLQQQ